MPTIQMKLNILDLFNQVIDFINNVDENIVTREMSVFDVKANIVIGRLHNIAEQAIIINDKKILDELLFLGVISYTDVSMEDKKDDGNNTKAMGTCTKKV
jgi:hypothetical protein